MSLKNKIIWTIVLIASLTFISESKNVDSEEIQLQLAKVKQRLAFKNNKLESCIKDAILKIDSSECLASIQSSDMCILSVGEYNKQMESYIRMRWSSYLSPTDTSMEVPVLNSDSIKTFILKNSLKECFIKNMSHKMMKDNSINDTIDSVLETKFNNRIKSAGDSLLNIRYKEYYNDFFSEIKKPKYNVLVSTDSLLIDSIINDRELNANYIFPEYHFKDLTKEMVKLVDSLNDKEWSSIIKTDWGFFSIAYNGDVIERVEISFEEAKPNLLYLMPINDINVNVSTDDVWEYYEQNEEQFKLDDTLTFELCFTPKIMSRKNGMINFNAENRPKKVVNSFKLPVQDKKYLLQSYNEIIDSNLIDLEMTFSFANLSKIKVKKSERIKSFKVVKDSIKNAMIKEKIDFIKQNMETTYAKKYDDLLSGILLKKFKKTLEPKDDKLNQLVLDYKNNKDNVKFNNDKLLRGNLKYKYVENRLVELTSEWIKEDVQLNQLVDFIIQ